MTDSGQGKPAAEMMVGLARWRSDAAPDYRAADEVEQLCRQALGAAGLTTDRGALGAAVPAGARVLIKPNWVLDRNFGTGGEDCLYTPHAFLLAALKLLVECRPASVCIGDSPIQGCRLEGILSDEVTRQARAVAGDVPVTFTDFRMVHLPDHNLAVGRVTTPRTEDDYVQFDLASASLLEPISTPPGRFRVTMYDPTVTNRRHQPGLHQYILAREVVEADVILNLPKLKTHKKTGLTAALKSFVGAIGSKDCLTHHRLGGSADGGDCYEGRDPVRRAAEALLDVANVAPGTVRYRLARAAAGTLLRLNARLGRPRDVEGSWYGNDTCWRMVLDLNRLVRYGRLDGTLADRPQRRVVSLVDGIIAGDGDGPLAPSPVPLGVVLASASPAAADWVGSLLLQLDPRRIPLVREAFGGFAHPVADAGADAIKVRDLDGCLAEEALVRSWGRPAKPAPGWAGHCEHPSRTVTSAARQD